MTAHNWKLLLVGDDPGSVIELAHELEGIAVQVVKASSLGETLNKLAKDEFVLLVIDVSQSVKEAIEIALRTRELPKSENLPILFVLTHNKAFPKEFSELGLGLIDFLYRPAPAGSLCAKVQMAIEVHRLRLALADEMLARRHAERRLAATSDDFRSVTSAANDGVVTTTDDGVVLSWNLTCEKLLDISADDAIGDSLPNLVAEPNNVATFAAAIGRADGKVLTINIRRRDGTKVPIELTVRAFSGPEMERRACIIRDLSERVRTEEALVRRTLEMNKRSREMRCLFECFSLIHSQENLEETCEQIVSVLPKAWLHGEVAVARLKVNGQCFATADYAEMELFLSAPIKIDDQLVGELRLDYLEDRPQQDVGPFLATEVELLTTLAHEIGKVLQLRQSEEAVKAARAAAEKSAAELKENLKESEALRASLERANEAACSANQAKDEFLARMSHEIRTPLNAIIGFAEILREEELSTEQRGAVDTIDRSAEILLSLVNDILDLSKVGSGRLELEELPFALEPLVMEACDVVRARLGNAPVEMLCDIDEFMPELIGDPTKLRQVLVNLLGNAVKFTLAGHICLVARTAGWDEEKGLVNIEFSVSDTGVGISEEQLERIFTAFGQADETITRRFGGTGLGLTISQRLVSLMGGELTVSSIVGEGSTFRFTLPLRRIPTWQESKTQSAPLSSRSCLIVDDNPLALEIHQSLLQRAGMSCQSASSTREAFTILARHLPDVILVDLDMPDKSGYDFCREVITRFGDKAPPQIALCPEVRPKSLDIQDAGFISHLLKPLRAKTVIEKVAKALQIEPSPTTPKMATALNEPTRRLSILLAEDTAMNQTLATWLLQRLGHDVTVVDNGANAVEMASRKAFDLILMDFQMPVMDGIAATKMLRDLGIKTPIIACTAATMRGDRERFLQAGMDDHLAKPFRRADLLVILSKHTGIQYNPILQEPNKVLVVDDDPIFLDVMISALKEGLSGITVRPAKTGIEACTLLGSFVPHLVVTDINMPGIDGLAVLEYIKGNERLAKTQVGIVSGLGEKDPRIVRAKSLGAAFTLEKPLPMGELIEAAAKALELPTVQGSPLNRLNSPLSRSGSPLSRSGSRLDGDDKDGTNEDDKPTLIEEADTSETMVVWNQERIMRLTSGDLAFIGTLLDIFSQEVVERLAAIEKALLPGGDLTIADRETHAIKGSASNLGGDRLQHVAARMVQAARSGEREKCNNDFERLKSEVDALIEAVGKATRFVRKS